MTDFPAGYFGCCGMSRARGHAGLCRLTRDSGIEARSGETGTGSISEADESPGARQRNRPKDRVQ